MVSQAGVVHVAAVEGGGGDGGGGDGVGAAMKIFH